MRAAVAAAARARAREPENVAVVGERVVLAVVTSVDVDVVLAVPGKVGATLAFPGVPGADADKMPMEIRFLRTDLPLMESAAVLFPAPTAECLDGGRDVAGGFSSFGAPLFGAGSSEPWERILLFLSCFQRPVRAPPMAALSGANHCTAKRHLERETNSQKFSKSKGIEEKIYGRSTLEAESPS